MPPLLCAHAQWAVRSAALSGHCCVSACDVLNRACCGVSSATIRIFKGEKMSVCADFTSQVTGYVCRVAHRGKLAWRFVFQRTALLSHVLGVISCSGCLGFKFWPALNSSHGFPSFPPVGIWPSLCPAQHALITLCRLCQTRQPTKVTL